eukprot:8732686-Pyramimonas_sp.AAC.1
MASSIPGALNKTAGYRLLGDQGGGLTTELELRGQGVLCRSSARTCTPALTALARAVDILSGR